MELLPSAESPPPKKKNYANTSKNLPKNKNLTLPEVRYLTWKIQFISNISWMTEAQPGQSYYALMMKVDCTIRSMYNQHTILPYLQEYMIVFQYYER